MPDATWQELYNAAIVEFDLTELPERVEVACQAIHQYRVRKQALSAAERNQLDDALRVLFTLMQRAACIVSAPPQRLMVVKVLTSAVPLEAR